LSQSRYADRFVLKGAQLFQIWSGAAHRPTRDTDLLSYGEVEILGAFHLSKFGCGIHAYCIGMASAIKTLCYLNAFDYLYNGSPQPLEV